MLVRFKENGFTFEQIFETFNENFSKVYGIKKRHIRILGTEKYKERGLAVSRALGDKFFPEVTVIPAMTAVSLSNELVSQASILQACDGLWGILSPRQVGVLADFYYNNSNGAYSLLKRDFFSKDLLKSDDLSEQIYQFIQ